MLGRNLQSKNDALEALDSIVDVLQEHRRDLDKLVNELVTVAEQLSETGELTGKVGKVEDKINILKTEVTNLITCLSSVQTALMVCSEPSVIWHCKRWEDFQTLAFRAKTVAFSYIEAEKIFHADALKGNQIIAYSDVIPKFSAILKAWLSKELDVSERSIFEGVFSLR